MAFFLLYYNLQSVFYQILISLDLMVFFPYFFLYVFLIDT